MHVFPIFSTHVNFVIFDLYYGIEIMNMKNKSSKKKSKLVLIFELVMDSVPAGPKDTAHF